MKIMIAKLPDLVRPTVWKLGIRAWWGGVFTVEVTGACYPEDALEQYEQSGQPCDSLWDRGTNRVTQMQFYCPSEKLWKPLPQRDLREAIVLVRSEK